MQKHTTLYRPFILMLAISAMLLATSASAQAAGNHSKASITTLKIEPSLQFVSTDKLGDTYQVSFDSDVMVNFSLSISNEKGEILFSENYESASFSKFIKLQKDLVENESNLQFNIAIMPFGDTYSFEVNNSGKEYKSINRL